MTTSSTMVPLVTAPNEPEAQMWADSLRAQGIDVFVRPGGPGVGAWGSVASFEHALYVRHGDLITARRIVAVFSRKGLGSLGLPRRRNPPRTRPVIRRR